MVLTCVDCYVGVILDGMIDGVMFDEMMVQGSNFVKTSTCPTDKWICKTTCP